MARTLRAALVAAHFLAACGGPPPPSVDITKSLGGYPGELTRPADIPGDFVWQQRVTSRYRDDEHTFDVVVEKVGSKLTVVGLTPFGSPAFALIQNGSRLELQAMVRRKLPFPPRAVLVDINRVYIGVSEVPMADGWNVVQQGAETVRERWAGGRLRERRFTRRGGPQGVIVVRYPGGMLGLTPPRRASLSNGWYGYSLEIDTVVAQQPGAVTDASTQPSAPDPGGAE